MPLDADGTSAHRVPATDDGKRLCDRDASVVEIA